MIPLSEPNIGKTEGLYVQECLDTGWVSTGGPFVTRFEQAVRDFTGAKHAVATTSGTAALHLSLLIAGVQPDDAVIVPTITFVAPANAVRYVGAHPVFIGCDEFLNLDASAVERFLEEECLTAGGQVTERATGRRVSAVVPVHVFGVPADMHALGVVADRFGLEVIEDASEALGSFWTAGPLAGLHAGALGRFGVLSFNANKIVTAGGGGMLLTDDDAVAERALYLSTQAKSDPVRYTHGDVGYNYRLTSVAAALGLGQLERADEFIATKRGNFELYAELLAPILGISLVAEPTDTRSNRWFYGLDVDAEVAKTTRDTLMDALARRDIQTRPVWDPLHRQAPFSGCRAFAVESAESAHGRVLNLPCSTALSTDDVHVVAAAIRDAIPERETN